MGDDYPRDRSWSRAPSDTGDIPEEGSLGSFRVPQGSVPRRKKPLAPPGLAESRVSLAPEDSWSGTESVGTRDSTTEAQPPMSMNLKSEAGASLLPKRDTMSKDTWQDRKGEIADAHRAEEAVTGRLTEISVSETATVALEVSALPLCSQA